MKLKTFTLLAAGLLAGLAQAADINYFTKPPSVEELEKALQGSSPSAKPASSDAAKPARRSRGIKWDADPAAAAEKSAPVEAPPAEAADSGVIALPINFNLGSSTIAGQSLGFLESIAGLMDKNPQMRLQVEGHTDNTGDARNNTVLSWDRAYSVFRQLVTKYNIDPARLQPIGKGSAEPLPGRSGNDPLNRRVQFRMIGG